MAVPDSQIKYFANLLGGLAVAECNRRIAAGLGFVLPSVCVAQSAHETGWGTAGIMVKANAFFGIKAGGSWTGKIYVADTWEVAENGERYNTVANFRAYDSLEDSVADYYNLTVNNSRYAKGISYGADPTKWLSAKETLTELWAGGYATDDLYVPHVMNLLNGRNLTSYDTLITGEPPVSFSFTKADFTQGRWYRKSDDTGIEFRPNATGGIGLREDKLITLEKDSTLSFNFSADYMIFLSYVTDGVAKTAIILNVSETISLPKGTTIAITVMLNDEIDGQLSYDTTPDNFSLNISETLGGTLPDHAESLTTGIAHFIKVE